MRMAEYIHDDEIQQKLKDIILKISERPMMHTQDSGVVLTRIPSRRQDPPLINPLDADYKGRCQFQSGE